ncbi:MAG: helix-turn-helix domain-containing protein [Hamadaea sp.]|nr:helix-turn-helix domain-containing protein [Hamadaea sp.]
MLAALEVIASASQPPSLSVLSRRIGAPKSTVHRLLDVLVRRDVLERTTAGYALSPTMRRLSQLMIDRTPKDVVELLEPFAGDLFERTGDYVVIGVPDNGYIVAVHSIRSHRHANLPLAVDRVPAQLSAIGKLWLAQQTGGEPAYDLPAQPGKVLSELRRIRRSGVATVAEHGGDPVTEVAMPIIGVRGMVAGIARRLPPGEPVPLASTLVHQQIAIAASAAARRFEAHGSTRS